MRNTSLSRTFLWKKPWLNKRQGSDLKQYLLLKPVKRGIKVWVCADATNGLFAQCKFTPGSKDAKPNMPLVIKLFLTLFPIYVERPITYFDIFYLSLSC